MTDPFFFGYGSLVNRATHAHGEVYAARLAGWRRQWRSTPGHPVAFLTVAPEPGALIEGLIASVPGGDWAALDLRERGYRRHPLHRGLAHTATRPVQAQIYAVPDHDPDTAPPTVRPILLSYLDVVVQGFAREYGEAGALRFFETTQGWETPVEDDRAAPRYPRHQRLTAWERGLVDELLRSVGARIGPAR